MIYLSYDLMRQCTWASCEGKGHIRIDDKSAAQIPGIIDGLCDVGVVVKEPHCQPRVKVEYSDQAWNDLLRIGELE